MRRFNMERSGLKICFFGPSGSGKSTCFEMARDAIAERIGKGVRVYRADVARPLHEIQQNAYTKLGLAVPKQRLEDMRQDWTLLAFLASHFESHLGKACYAFVDDVSQAHPGRDAAFINTDCRNNAYDSLHDLGFWFVRVATDEEVVRERLAERQDITPCDMSAAVEQTDKIEAHWTLKNNGTPEELREMVGCVVQAAIFKREEFLSA